ncbi:MAG: hypothetical protein JW990_08015 [Thermoleophilia bacterium]|nr:hypothetical protein [Thermoleophilia bacterium]
MSIVSLAEHNTARALIHYLAQPWASAAVCGQSPAGFHVTLAALDGRGARQLVDGLKRRDLDARVWRQCLSQLFARCDARRGRHLSKALLEAMDQAVSRSLVEAPDRFAALVRAYRDRPQAFVTCDRQRTRLVARLKQRLRAFAGESVRRRHAAAALAVLEAESGRFGGQPVTALLLDRLTRSQDLEALKLLHRRLPDATIRRAAARRIVRLAIDASKHRELRSMARQVEDAVLRDGFFAVSFDQFPIISARIDEQALGAAPLQLLQHVLDQTALVRHGSSNSRISLRKVVWFTLRGISHPITLCAPGRSLDPTPCVSAQSLATGHPRTSIDSTGALTFSNWPSRAAAKAFLSPKRLFRIPIRAAGRVVAVIARPVRFTTPDAVWFRGAYPGGDGPAVHVDVRDGPRVQYLIHGAGRSLVAVVERSEVGLFELGSLGGRGRRGADGANGSDGSPGSDGSDASCPSSSGTSGSNGGDGQDGQDGEPGGAGGNGGVITVRVHCPGQRCASFVHALRATIRSVGGEGGKGGTGGRGGRGGAGGDGGNSASCTDSEGNTTYLSGGSDGSRGSDGSDGSDGPDGPPGRPGVVRLALGAVR